MDQARELECGWSGEPPRVVSAMLREGSRFWIAAGAAGGSELPSSAEPYAMRVALPVALARAIGLSSREAAELAGRSEGFEQDLGDLRWLRWSVEVDSGTFAALGFPGRDAQRDLARSLGQAVNCPLFARHELPDLQDGPGGDWAGGAPATIGKAGWRLFAVLEAKAIAETAARAPRGPGPGRI